LPSTRPANLTDPNLTHDTAFRFLARVLAPAPRDVAASPQTSAQPNIIFVMADDLGYTDVASSAASITRRP